MEEPGYVEHDGSSGGDTDTKGPTFSAPSLVINTGAIGVSGIRATITLLLSWPNGTGNQIKIHFCSDSDLPKFKDDVGLAQPKAWDLFLPIGLLDTVLQVLRNEPKRFVSYIMSDGGGGGYPIGQVGFNV